MNRRSFLGTIPALTPGIVSGATKTPNVIIILADDTGYGDYGFTGNPHLKTPHIDRLHTESVSFTDFHVMPMCTPTRSELMTGRDCLYTRAMNVSSGRTLLRRDFPTMAEIFAASGYRCGIFGKWHLGDTYPYRPEDRGFHEAVWYPSSHIGSVPDAWNNDYFNDRYRHNGRMEQYEGYCTDVYFGEATKFIRNERRAGRPFFAYIPLNAAHGPLFVPEKYRKPYEQLPERVARFYGMIANIDENVGKLDAMLSAEGLRENTILIYSADNGGTAAVGTFNAGLRANKTTLYDGGHRVPLLVRYPQGKIGGGKECHELTQVQDLLPTVMDLCRLRKPAGARFDGVSLAPVLQDPGKKLQERTLVIQFSRMNDPRPKKGDAALLWKNWRMVHGNELYDVAADRAQEKNIFAEHPEVVKRMTAHYEKWWQGVEPLLDSHLPLHIGSDKENPTLLSACEWADVFLDQTAQVRRGERKIAKWHVEVEQDGTYEIALRRWPSDADLPLSAASAPHEGEDNVYPAGVALPIRKARLKIADFDRTIEVGESARAAVFTVPLKKGRTTCETWFLDGAGSPITSAYYAYVRRMAPRAKVLFDTDIMGDVDDVGAVAALHALASRGEAEILGMGVCSKHPHSGACLAALNQYFGRPEIPIGLNRGKGFLRESKYAEQIASRYPHQFRADAAPDAAALYKKVLAAQPDRSVVFVTVGQLSNAAALISDSEGRRLVERKVKAWVCMGGQIPAGKEANIKNDAAAARKALAEWPGRVILSGFEIGLAVLTGGRLGELPAASPVREAYRLYNGVQAHKSWDQTAVLYAVRGLDQPASIWELSGPGEMVVDEAGANIWRDDSRGRHYYMKPVARPVDAARMIEELMLHQPS